MILLAVFVVFIIATFSEIDLDLLAPSTYPSVVDIVAAVALTFFAYLGFAVVATTAESIADPAKSVPRATYLALLISGGLYVLISLGVYGTLTVDEVIASGDTALADAAEPALGQAGLHDDGRSPRCSPPARRSTPTCSPPATSPPASPETGEFPPVFGRQVARARNRRRGDHRGARARHGVAARSVDDRLGRQRGRPRDLRPRRRRRDQAAARHVVEPRRAGGRRSRRHSSCW